MTSKKGRSHLATNIVNLRKARRWSQGELAHKVGVHVNTIKSIETDQNEGTFSTRMAIAGALEIELADLYKAPKTARPSQFENLTMELASRLLNYYQGAEPRRQLAALYLLSKDESFLAALSSLPEGARFAQVLEKLLRA